MILQHITVDSVASLMFRGCTAGTVSRLHAGRSRQVRAAWGRSYAGRGGENDHLPHNHPDRGHRQPHIWLSDHGGAHGRKVGRRLF